jgi:hypothetical protein
MIAMTRPATHLALLCTLAACTSRPPWAEGRMVRERRPAASAPQDLSRFQPRLLALHNAERAALGISALVWDPALAEAAAGYGPSLAARNRLAHSDPGTRPGQGENLWMGTRGAYSLEEMVGDWAAEKKLFRPGVFPQEVSASRHWSDVAHYTQMIWPGSERVGCALHSAAGWDYLICRYSPAGNVVGRKVP